MSRLRNIRRKRKHEVVPAETLIQRTTPDGMTIVMTAGQAADLESAMRDPETRAALSAYARGGG